MAANLIKCDKTKDLVRTAIRGMQLDRVDYRPATFVEVGRAVRDAFGGRWRRWESCWIVDGPGQNG